MPPDRTAHWDDVWAVPAEAKTWYQARPEVSLRLLARFAPGSVIDIGGGASTLVDGLVAAGRTDVSVLDVSPRSLEQAAERLGPDAARVTWVVADVVSWDPPRRYDAWHDRATFHFLTTDPDRVAYRQVLDRALAPGGHVVIAAFADDGPDRCSGLGTTRWREDDLVTEFADLDAVHFEREQHRTPSGDTQRFLYAVFRRPE